MPADDTYKLSNTASQSPVVLTLREEIDSSSRHVKSCVYIPSIDAIVTAGKVTDKSSKFAVSIPGDVSGGFVIWHKVSLVKEIPNQHVSAILNKLIQDMSVPDVTLTVFKGIAKMHKVETARASVQTARDLTVLSTPFGLVNSVLFSNFASSGSIAMDLGDMLLSDIRYLSGMEGALALYHDQLPAGIVLGGLRKKNGQGDLLIVLKWQFLGNLLDLPTWAVETNPTLASELYLHHQKQLASTVESSPAVLITVRRSGSRRSWGTGTIIASNTIVTNAHVVKDALSISCHTIAGRSFQVSVRSIPWDGLDLAILQIPEEHSLGSEIASIVLRASLTETARDNSGARARIPFNSSPRKGESVYSYGYGLISPSQYSFMRQSMRQSAGLSTKHSAGHSGASASGAKLCGVNELEKSRGHGAEATGIDGRGFGPRPLRSCGIVSQIAQSNGTCNGEGHVSGSVVGKVDDPAMVICSSACWNGSSGGPVVDEDNRLVGIMAANAKFNGDIIPEIAFVIPAAVISKALAETGSMQPITRKLWGLEATHQDLVVDGEQGAFLGTKPKL